jgi:outer membrane protein assembly factor BamB
MSAYRDDREALRARVSELEDKLARAEETIADLRGLRSPRPARRRIGRLLVAGTLFLVTGLGLLGAVLRPRHAPRPQPTETAEIPASFVAAPRPPMLAQIGPGGALGPIAWGRSGDKACLAGFDGRSGARLWLTCPYRTKATDDARSARIGGRVLVDFERTLQAFDAKSGAPLWSSRLDERTFEFCLRPDGTLRVSLEGSGGTFSVDQETGSVSPSTRTYDCEAVWDDRDWRNRALPGQSVASRGYGISSRNSVPAVDGMVPELTVRYAGRTVVAGYARPGAHAPMAAAMAESGALQWKRGLDHEGVSTADAGGPYFVALDDRRLCGVYPAKDGDHLGCWDAATGKTLWDVKPTGPAGGFHGVAMTDHEVLLQFWGGFAVFDAGSGALLYDVR